MASEITGRGGLGALLLGEKPKMYEVALVDEKWVEDDKLEKQDSEGESEEGDGLKKEKAMGLWGDITVRFDSSSSILGHCESRTGGRESMSWCVCLRGLVTAMGLWRL